MRSADKRLLNLLAQAAFDLQLLVLLNFDPFDLVLSDLRHVRVRPSVQGVILVGSLALQGLPRGLELCRFLLDPSRNRPMIHELVRVTRLVNFFQTRHAEARISLHRMFGNYGDALHQRTFLRATNEIQTFLVLKGSIVLGVKVPFWLVTCVLQFAALLIQDELLVSFAN